MRNHTEESIVRAVAARLAHGLVETALAEVGEIARYRLEATAAAP